MFELGADRTRCRDPRDRHRPRRHRTDRRALELRRPARSARTAGRGRDPGSSRVACKFGLKVRRSRSGSGRRSQSGTAVVVSERSDGSSDGCAGRGSAGSLDGLDRGAGGQQCAERGIEVGVRPRTVDLVGCLRSQPARPRDAASLLRSCQPQPPLSWFARGKRARRTGRALSTNREPQADERSGDEWIARAVGPRTIATPSRSRWHRLGALIRGRSVHLPFGPTAGRSSIWAR